MLDSLSVQTTETRAMIPQTVNLLAISKKGKSRIGTKLTTAIIEQDHHDRLFVVFPGLNSCRWILRENDPDFKIIPTDCEDM